MCQRASQLGKLRILKICEILRVVSPVGFRSKKSIGSASKRRKTCNDNRRVNSGRDDLDEFAASVPEQRFVACRDNEYQRDHGERRHGVVRDHPVDRDHNEERWQDLQDAQADRSSGDLPKIPPLLQHEARNPRRTRRALLRRTFLARGERAIRPLAISLRGEARRPRQARRRDGLDPSNRLRQCAIARDQNARAAVGKQEHQRGVRLNSHELPPTQARRLGPQSVFARPGDQSCGRGHFSGSSSGMQRGRGRPRGTARQRRGRPHALEPRPACLRVSALCRCSSRRSGSGRWMSVSESTKQLRSRSASAFDGVHKKATPSCANSIRH